MSEKALEFLDVAKYDAIVLDAMMPVMDGFEFLKAVRARRLGTPVLFLTARDAKEDIITGLDLSADDYMLSPLIFVSFWRDFAQLSGAKTLLRITKLS